MSPGVPTSTAAEHPTCPSQVECRASQAHTPATGVIYLSVHLSLLSGPCMLPCRLLYGDNKYDFFNMILLRSQRCAQANLPFNTWLSPQRELGKYCYYAHLTMKGWGLRPKKWDCPQACPQETTVFTGSTVEEAERVPAASREVPVESLQMTGVTWD